MNSLPLPSLPQVVTLRVAGFVPTERLESIKATRAPARVGSGSARSALAARAGVTRKTCTLKSVLESIDRSSKTLQETLESQMNVDNLTGAAKTRHLLEMIYWPHLTVAKSSRSCCGRAATTIATTAPRRRIGRATRWRTPHTSGAFVRARDGSDSWTHHDRRSAVAVGAFANVVQRCRDGPMLPYLLFYDSLTAAPGA